MLRTTLLAGAALALAAPAHAATIELRAGPVSLAPGQIVRALPSNTGTALCRSRLVFLYGVVQEDGSVQLTRHQSIDATLSAGPGLVGICDPNVMPALVQAEVVIECRSLTAAQTRAAVRLSLDTAASGTGPALVTMQGTE